jgi:hypothetical protein
MALRGRENGNLSFPFVRHVALWRYGSGARAAEHRLRAVRHQKNLDGLMGFGNELKTLLGARKR